MDNDRTHYDAEPVAELFGKPKAMVGMVHVAALPGTPFASRSIMEIVRQAVTEAKLLAQAGFDAIIVENMHDRPYLRQQVGPEIVAAMTAVATAVRQAVDLPMGIQVLAAANREALAVALAAGAHFIRAENFVFSHVADEGLMPSADAGPLLRYRREIGAEHVRIFADIKKKHASHAMTADLGIAEIARAAEFFAADGMVVTGISTGRSADMNDLRNVGAAVRLPIAVGSGITAENLPAYWELADIFIVGSFIKEEGQWHRPMDPQRMELLMQVAQSLCSAE